MSKIAVVIPNLNGQSSLDSCIDSLEKQSMKIKIVIVDNGSNDSSLKVLKKYKNIELIKHTVNKGYAGGVNPGFRFALNNKYTYVATLNNDAVARYDWIKELVDHCEKNHNTGIATSKILDINGKTLDSTGEFYSNWGLPYPRGRGEDNLTKYDKKTNIFGASGGASLYRVDMLKEIGLFDESFFAYYEDVDLSFRAQLAGWKVKYVPSAVVLHQIGATSGKFKGFTTYQTLKNLPLVLIKNVPRKYFFRVWVRFSLAYSLFFLRALNRLHLKAAVKGVVMAIYLSPKALVHRRYIQKTRVVSDEYIWSMIVHDLPPNAYALRRLRSSWWKLRGKHE